MKGKILGQEKQIEDPTKHQPQKTFAGTNSRWEGKASALITGPVTQ